MLDVEFAQLSDPGRVRQQNEDFLGCVLPDPEIAARPHWLFVLADGVGGMSRGDLASRTAVESLTQGFRKTPPGDLLGASLLRLVQAANAAVYETALTTGRSGTAMATTIVACALRFDRAVIAHVGDSRCYLIRNGRAAALTRDHTVVGEQLRLGLVSPQEARTAQTTHVLSRSLGIELFVNVDVSEHQIYSGDTLLLCSDGFHNSVLPEDLALLLPPGRDLHTAAGDLVDLARQRDGSDNISVQLIRIRDVERVGLYRGRHYKLR